MRDPTFNEFFVFNAHCHLTDTISKTKLLCNGTRAQYHSLILDHDSEDLLRSKLNRSKPRDVITLQKRPLAINVLIDDPNIVANAAFDWSRLLLENIVFLYLFVVTMIINQKLKHQQTSQFP